MFRKLFRRPRLSIIVVVYDMAREAPRTLRSLSQSYQQGSDAAEYEVIVVDNGSPVPLGEEQVRHFGTNFRYHYIEDASSSPARAVNLGVEMSRGEYVCISVDGARINTPGLIASTLRALRAYENPTVATLNWHLGPKPQKQSIKEGYCKETEDELLKAISWPDDGYRLFEIGALGGSSMEGCFRAIGESNTVTLPRSEFERLGGYDVRFDLPGGGLVSADFFQRCCARPGSQLVILPGEGSFHQLHGGASASEDIEKKFKHWLAHYEGLRGQPWRVKEFATAYLGKIPPQAFPYLEYSTLRKMRTIGTLATGALAAGKGEQDGKHTR